MLQILALCANMSMNFLDFAQKYFLNVSYSHNQFIFAEMFTEIVGITGNL